jgi:O-antigen/teichoic acid export membrane protein
MATHKNNNDSNALGLICRRYTNGYCLVSIPALLGMTVLASSLLQTLGTSEFAISPLLFGLIALGLFSDQFSASAHYLVYLHNEATFMRNIMVLSGILNLLLNILTIPFWGILGAAISTLLSYALLDFLLFRRVISYGYRIAELYDFRTLGKFALGAIGMTIAIYLMKGYAKPNLVVMVGIVGIGLICYGMILIAVKGFRV